MSKTTKRDTELLADMPASFTMTIDWDNVAETCDADRRNCAIHNALKGRRDITRPSVGLDEVNFIWKGDARVRVIPNAQVQKVIAKNDLASAGEIPWPTGKEVVKLDLARIEVKKDLRTERAKNRKWREENPEKKVAANAKWRTEEKMRDYAERTRKRLETEATRGRLV